MWRELGELQSVLKAPCRESYDYAPDGAEEGRAERIAPIVSSVLRRERGILLLEVGEQAAIGEDATKEPDRRDHCETYCIHRWSVDEKNGRAILRCPLAVG